LRLLIEKNRLRIGVGVLFVGYSFVSLLDFRKPFGLLMHNVCLLRYLITLLLLVAGPRWIVVLVIVDLGSLGFSVWLRATELVRVIFRVVAHAVESIPRIVLLALRWDTVKILLRLMIIAAVVIVVPRLASLTLGAVLSSAAGLGTVVSLGTSLASLCDVAVVVTSLLVHGLFVA